MNNHINSDRTADPDHYPWEDGSFFLPPLPRTETEDSDEVVHPLSGWKVAQEMRVLFCALITAHKRKDEIAFYATVEIVKKSLSQYANFDEEDWALFRRDVPRRDEK